MNLPILLRKEKSSYNTTMRSKPKQSFIINGLAGDKKLEGEVTINGAKNAALPAMAASILFDGPVTLENIPNTDDIETTSNILSSLGAKVERKDHRIVIDPTHISNTNIDNDLAQKMRASVILTGPLLARSEMASFPIPGGCVIGNRPIEQFLNAYQKMGAVVEQPNGVYEIQAPDGGLRGATIFFDLQTVTGTETLMIAAVLASGKTILKNCATEPEITSLAEWFNNCGAKISGIGTSTLTIEGSGGKLLQPVTPYRTIPDRIEAGSYLILGALCAKDIVIKDCEPEHMESIINLLMNSGVQIEVGKNQLRVTNIPSSTNDSFKSFNVRTHEYPGFPTDLQSPLVTFLTQVSGDSIVFESIFEGRFKYTEELIKMGADITAMNPREILIKGPTPLIELPEGEVLNAHDIRAGFAVVLAALVGKGKYTVNQVHLIDRGYEKLEERLTAIGANIMRVVN